MDKRELAVIFIKEVDELDKDDSMGTFSWVSSQGKAVELAKSIPNDFENILITTLYSYLIRKEGVFANLRFVKEAHYPLLLNAFEKVAQFLDSDKGGLLSNIEMLFLFNYSKDNLNSIQATKSSDFKAFLSVIMHSKKYAHIRGIASHQESFATYAKNSLIVERAISTIEKIQFEMGNSWIKTRLFWGLLSIILFDKSDKSISLIHRFIGKKLQLKRKRTAIYCFSQILDARKNEPPVKNIIREIQTQYPREWTEEYIYEPY